MTILRPKINLLTNQYIETILNEAKNILNNLGVLIENKDAQELLNNEGLDHNGQRYYIPIDLIEKCCEMAPRSISLYDREGNESLELSNDKIHYDPGSAAIFIQDYDTGEIRKALSSDYIKFTKIVSYLDHFDAQSTSLVYSDIPTDAQDWHRLYLALIYCNKPIITGTFRVESFSIMRQLLEVTRNSPKQLAAKPLAIFDACPSPPLMWSNLTTQSVIDAAKAGIPSEFVSMPLSGSTAPITLIGSITQHAAESLAGVVISQLARRGAPIIWGGSPAIFDMKQGTTPMGAIETMMINIGDAEIGKSLDLPTHAYMTLSDSKVPDAQAGLEAAMGGLLGALAGINMISGPGMLDFESTQSFEKLIIDHEVVGMSKRLIKGIIDYGKPFAEKILSDYDANYSLLSHPITLSLFRKELFFPTRIGGIEIINRETREKWKSEGETSARQRAKKMAKNLSERPPKIPIDSLTQKELNKIASEFLNKK